MKSNMAKKSFPNIVRTKKSASPAHGVFFWVMISLVAIVSIVILYFVVQYLWQLSKKKEGYSDPKAVELILIYNPQCPHCRDFMPIFESMKSRSKDLFVKPVVMTQMEAKDAGSLMNYVSGVPCVIVRNADGKVITTITGKRTETAFIQQVNQALQIS